MSGQAESAEQPEFLPTEARELVAELREHTGAEPRVTRIDHGVRVEMESDRVVLTMDYRRSARPGKWSYNSALRVDGAQVPYVENPKQFGMLWRDPDLNERRWALEVADLANAHVPEVVPAPADAHLPPLVETIYHRQAPGLAKRGGTVRVGLRDDEWQILAETQLADGRAFQMYIGCAPDGQGGYTKTGLRIVLALDGKDVTHRLDEIDLSELGLSAPGDIAPGDTAPRHPHGQATRTRQNSVEVRRGAVIRI